MLFRKKLIHLLVLLLFVQAYPLLTQTYWEQTNGPRGIHLTTIAFASSDTIFIGAQYSGLFISTNGGITWKAANGIEGYNIDAITVTRNGWIIANLMNAIIGKKIWRSTDLGQTWHVASNGLPLSTGITALTTLPSGDILASAWGIGVYRSSTGGDSWVPSFQGSASKHVKIRGFDRSPGGVIYGGGLMKSLDNGFTWSPMSGTHFSRVKAVNDSLVFTASIMFGPYLLRSTDTGSTWLGVADSILSDQDDIFSFVVDSSEQIFISTTIGQFNSTDLGKTWRAFGGQLHKAKRVTLASDSVNRLYVLPYGYGISSTTDHGVTWTYSDSGLFGMRVLTLCNSPSAIYAGTANGMIFRSDNQGNDWLRVYIDSSAAYYADYSGASVPITYHPSGIVIASFSRRGVIVSSDQGMSWGYRNSGLVDLSVNDLLVLPSGRILAGTGGGVHFSDNECQSWQVSSSGMQSIPTIFALTYSQASGAVYALTSDSAAIVYRSTDEGITWQPTRNGLHKQSPAKRWAFIASDSEGNIFVARDSREIYHSQEGQQWVPLPSRPSEAYNFTRAIAVNTIGHIFTATDSGMIVSTNRGKEWLVLNEGLQQKDCHAISFSDSGRAFVGTYGRSVFRSHRSTTLVPPGTTILVAPPDTATDVPLNQLFTWHPVDRAESYRLQISESRDFDSVHIDLRGIRDTSTTVGQLSTFKRYYWRVSSENQFGQGLWSHVWSFTTIPPIPDHPQLIAPSDGSIDLGERIAFRWQPVLHTETYQLQIALDPVFQQIWLDRENIRLDTNVVAGLLPATKFYWRVRAVNLSGSGQWSEVWSFSVQQLPVAPMLLFPPSGTQLILNATTFRWDSVDLASRYNIILSNDSLFPHGTSRITTRNEYWFGRLAMNARYYWRVRAVNDAGNGAWSDVWSFTTGSIVSSVGGESDADLGKVFLRNHPNPFSERTTMQLFLPMTGKVRLEIYDLHGRHIETLIDRIMEAGNHDISFTVDFTGVYLCALRVNESVHTRLIHVVK